MNKISNSVGLIVGPDTGNEYEAIRQTLEYLNFQVVVKYIARPLHLVEVFAGQDNWLNNLETWIFSFHGFNGKWVMPELAEDLYQHGEPKGDLYLHNPGLHYQLSQQRIISTACESANQGAATCFLEGGAQCYIAPKGEIEGSALLVYIHLLFYKLSIGNDFLSAGRMAQQLDSETQRMKIFFRNEGAIQCD